MIESGDIIKIIDTILCEQKLRKHPWPLHIKTSQFAPQKISRYWLRKILFKLEAEKCIRDIIALNSSKEWHFAIADTDKDFTISFNIDEKKLKEYKNYLLKDEGQNFPQRKLLYKNAQEDYFYNGEKIDMSKDTIYYKVLDILSSRCDQEGFLSYESIEKYLTTEYREDESEDEDKRNKRIINAINNQLFRFAKVNGNQFKNKTFGKSKLIEIKRGKGLKLNNPNLDTLKD